MGINERINFELKMFELRFMNLFADCLKDEKWKGLGSENEILAAKITMGSSAATHGLSLVMGALPPDLAVKVVSKILDDAKSQIDKVNKFGEKLKET